MRARLRELKLEHRDLDVVIATFSAEPGYNQIQLRRLKKRKLQLKDSIAVMVCSHADENCPFIPGVRKRLSLPFEDPKEFDGKVNEKEAYLDSFWQICAELYCLMQCLSREVR